MRKSMHRIEIAAEVDAYDDLVRGVLKTWMAGLAVWTVALGLIIAFV
jgi:hypothetical protein